MTAAATDRVRGMSAVAVGQVGAGPTDAARGFARRPPGLRSGPVAALLALVRKRDEAVAALGAGADEAAVVAGAPRTLSSASPVSRIGWMILPAPAEAWLRSASDRPPDAGPRVWLPVEAADAIRAARAAGFQVAGFVAAAARIDADVLVEAGRLGLTEVLVATPPFSGQHLLAMTGIGELSRLADLCRAAGLRFGFAGALELPDVPRLLALEPDVIGLDDALRDASGRFDPGRMAGFREAMASPRAVDGGLPSERPDRIFIRDWIVPMRIGAYARERGQAQRVRFTVEAEVAHSDDATGMAGIVSYDLITDAIARLATDHIDLVEELAERLARRVLAAPRVLSLDVTVEKLDVGPGSVGCRIFRRRGPV